MKLDDVNSKLRGLYGQWKINTSFTDEQAASLSPPLLLHATDEYLSSKIRVIVFGQETTGWKWTRGLQTEFPNYPNNWEFKDIQYMNDFLSNDDSIEGLCWGYKEFNFGARQRNLSKTPFWQAFSTISSWPGVGTMWNNLVKVDYRAPGTSWSILQAPAQTREAFINQQASLIRGEIDALQPHVCIFLTGPNYDPILTSTFPGCVFTAANGYSKRALVKVIDRALPEQSFRTYHPKFLRMSGSWNYLDHIRTELQI